MTLETWHKDSLSQITQKLRTSLVNGLDDQEASLRLEREGLNIIKIKKRKNTFQIFLNQFSNLMIIILIGAAFLAGFFGEIEDTFAIAIIVLLNAVLGFAQEYKAEKALNLLKTFSTFSTEVIRSGKRKTVSSETLVIGDVISLETGSLVPADIRLIESHQLQIQEALLTGESLSINKNAHQTINQDTVFIGERFNMAFKGTTVTHGRAKGLVVSTGMKTEFGRIAGLLNIEKEIQTPLQKKLNEFGKKISFGVLILCFIIFIVGILRGEKALLMFMTALSLAVAAIPEALPAIVTLLLAFGAKKMILRKTLIRSLPAVETLGSVTFICTDKTGTLTENRMRLENYAFDLKEDPLKNEMFYLAMALCNDTYRGANKQLCGDPTENALFHEADLRGYNKEELEKKFHRVYELPFSSERSMMSTLNKKEKKLFVFSKGAPEKIISSCDFESEEQKNTFLNATLLLNAAHMMAAKGYRVIAFAFKEISKIPSNPSPETIEKKLTFLNLVGLIDPPRSGVKEAIELCQNASIHVAMITGDHPATALTIAKRLGIVSFHLSQKDAENFVLTGSQVEKLSPDELEAQIQNIRVYARVSPEHKIKIVQALQDKGEFVAMTGDGVNDAPALKRANIGIAMGKTGSDVARESAAMILLDDNFTSIVDSVREGRRIYDNIKKFVKYALTGNLAEIGTIFLAPFLDLPMPLIPLHILWINLITDGLPGLALVNEPEEENIMNRPPRSPKESIFGQGLWEHTLWVGFLMTSLNLCVLAWAYHSGSKNWQSMIFTVLTLSQLGHILAIRSDKSSLNRRIFFSNTPLLVSVVLTIILQLATLYYEPLRRILKTHSLNAKELFACLFISSLTFFILEGQKYFTQLKTK